MDFYLSRSRRSFMSEAARLFKETVDTIETDTNRLIEQLEAYVQKRQTAGASTVTLVIRRRQGRGHQSWAAKRISPARYCATWNGWE